MCFCGWLSPVGMCMGYDLWIWPGGVQSLEAVWSSLLNWGMYETMESGILTDTKYPLMMKTEPITMEFIRIE